MSDFKELAANLVQQQILQAFRTQPEVVEAMIKDALGVKVDQHGLPPSGHHFNSKQMPFVEWLVGDTIRKIAREAVLETIREQEPLIRESVHRALNGERLVEAVTKQVVGAFGEDWRINIAFANGDKD